MLVTLRTFRKRMKENYKFLRRYLTRLEKDPPPGLDRIAAQLDAEVWEETDCLSCGNCCKRMTPTFKRKDIARISAHLNMTPEAFREKWLTYDKKDDDWVNKKQPCQFLDMKTNFCSIYTVRPADCAGFPYLKKRSMKDYLHVHKQNVEYCPATYRMVEKMMERVVI